MAILLNKNSGEEVVLRSHHVFGRASAKTDTFINDSTISLVHASIRWNGAAWELVDHSRNGTWLNTSRLSDAAILKTDDEIAFKRDAGESWVLSDDTPPQNMLIALNASSSDIVLDSIHILPDEKNPKLALFMVEQSKWLLSDDGIEKELSDGDFISLYPDYRWRFQKVLPASETLNIDLESQNIVEQCYFEFHVSADEEHTTLTIDCNKDSINLGERVHHYLMLTLARKKIDDHKNGVGEDSEGWVEISDLQKMLGMDSCHINIHIYRARQQIKKQLKIVENSLEFLERRFGSIRFAGKKYQIFRAGNLESSYQTGF